MQTIYLSRRNLESLLSKLDRKVAGEDTACAIIKYQQPDSVKFKQSTKAVTVIAVDDEEYYTAQERPAGLMHPLEESKISTPSTGTGVTWF